MRDTPGHFWARCLQAICFVNTADFDAANSNLIACLKDEPDSAWLYLLRGYTTGKQAADHLKKAGASPGRESDLNRVAEDEFNNAEADFQSALKILKRTPDNDLLYILFVNRGVVRFQRDHLDEAAADYLAAIRTKQDPNAHANLAFVYRKQGKIDEAVAQLSEAIALDPDSAPLYRGRAEFLQDRPDATSADRQAAQADLKLAIRYEDNDNHLVLARDHTNLGRLYYADQQLDDALEETKRALRAAPEDPNASVLQFQVLLQLPRYDELIRACDTALSKGRKSAVIHEFRGLALSKNGDYPGAIHDFGLALELRPQDATLLKERGWAYLNADAPKLALADFDAAIKFKPGDADAFTGRGSAHAKLGDHRAAIADARAAIQADKTDPRVKYNAARIYAFAAPLAASEVGEKGRAAGVLASQYLDSSVQFIRECFEQLPPEERPAFWRKRSSSTPP